MKLDIKRIKRMLTLENYRHIISSLDIPILRETSDKWVLLTGCHHLNPQDGSAKLEFYIDTKMFHCYTHCGSFDLIELIAKRWRLYNKEFTFIDIVEYIVKLCGLCLQQAVSDIDDWRSRWAKFLPHKHEEIALSVYDKSILSFFEDKYSDQWIKEGISVETMQKYLIKYYPRCDAIVIPVFDEEERLVGIRNRFLNPDDCRRGKYRPLELLNGTSYKFPSSECLFGVNHTQQAIVRHKKCVLFEAEKSVMQCDTMFGEDNFSVAMFGNNLSVQNRDWILAQGVKEVCIALDFDYDEVGDDDYKAFVKNVMRLAKMFENFVRVSYMVSNGGHKKKDSPSDNGKDVYKRMWEKREKCENLKNPTKEKSEHNERNTIVSRRLFRDNEEYTR